MGASESSTRRMTIVDDDKSGVIVISESVVERLKGEIKGEKKEQQQHQQQPQQQQNVSISPPPPAPVGRPIVYNQEPSLSALQVRSEKEEEIKELEAYYQKRLQELQSEHSRMSDLSEASFQEASKKVDKLFARSRESAVCTDFRKSVVECYQKNAKTPLNCSSEVKAFKGCVDSARSKSG